MTGNLILLMLLFFSVGFVTGGTIIYMFCMSTKELQNAKDEI